MSEQIRNALGLSDLPPSFPDLSQPSHSAPQRCFKVIKKKSERKNREWPGKSQTEEGECGGGRVQKKRL